jgi:hypothetical protein
VPRWVPEWAEPIFVCSIYNWPISKNIIGQAILVGKCCHCRINSTKLLFGRCCATICGDFLLSNCTFIKSTRHIKRRCGNIFAFCQVLENGKCAKSAVPYTPVYYSYHDHAHSLKIAGILISCNGTELRVNM